MSTFIPGISVRDQMIAQAANGRPFIDALLDLGVDSIELQLDFDLSLPHARDESGASFNIPSLAKLLESHSMRISSLLLMTDFSSAQAEAHVAWAIRAVQWAEAIDTPVIRIDPLTGDQTLSPAFVRDNFIARIGEVLRETAGMNVDLGIENHGIPGNDPGFLDAIFAAVDDPRLGLTLDTGNFYWSGAPLNELYQLLERYAPRAKHTHIKNINYPPALANMRREAGLDYAACCCPLDEGNIDIARVVRMLIDAGYRRDFCIENEALGKVPAGQRMSVLKRDVTLLMQNLAHS